MNFKEKSNNTKFSINYNALAFLVVFSVLLVTSLYQMKLIKNLKEDVHQTNISSQENINNLSNKVDGIQDSLATLAENDDELEKLITDQAHKLSALKSSKLKEEKSFKDFIYKIEQSMNLLSGENKKEDTDPMKNRFSYYKSPDWIRKSAQFIQENKREKRPMILPQRAFDGLAGTDTFNMRDAGILPVNGFYLRSIEKYNITNGSKNTVIISAPGLVNLENDLIEITGDPELDTIVLDGCLSWKVLASDDTRTLYRATDQEKKTRDVKITGKLKIINEPNCNQDYFTKHNVASLQNAWNSGPVADLKKEHEEPVEYKIQKRENLKFYKEWLSEIDDLAVRRNLGFLINLMEHDKIPTEFPIQVHGSPKALVMQMLYFNPKNSVKDISSIKPNCSSPTSLSRFIINAVNKTEIKCIWGNQIFTLDDKDQNLDDPWGNDIIFPAKGNDFLKMGWGQDIVILEKGWGQKTISKNCQKALVNNDELYNDYLARPVFMGIGISFKSKKDFLFIDKVMEGGAADKSGLKSGDRITKISGKHVSRLSRYQVVQMLRGNSKKTIPISYIEYPSGKEKSTSLVPSMIEIPQNINNSAISFERAPEKYQKIQYTWPYKYNNFIIFGPEIKREEVEWENDNTLVHKPNGDRITFKGQQCFEFIYSGSVSFPKKKDLDRRVNKKPKNKPVPIVFSENTSKKNGTQKIGSTPSSGAYMFPKGIPRILHNGLYPRKDLPNYLLGIDKTFMKATRNKDVLDESVILEEQNLVLKNAGRIQRQHTLKYDENLDGKVTMDEIKSMLGKIHHFANKHSYENMLESTLSSLGGQDKNKDGIISNSEMVIIAPEKEKNLRKSASARYKEYFDIDPNQDGKLTRLELKTLAENLFLSLDVDSNKKLSVDELTAGKKGYKKKRKAPFPDVETLKKVEFGTPKRSLDENEKIRETIKKIKMVDAASSTFRDMYDSTPGDMPNAEKRLPNCKSHNCGSGDGNGKVEGGAFDKVELLKDERHLYWVHLSKADLLDGYKPDSKIAKWGEAFPSSPLGGGFQMYFYNGKEKLPNSFEGTSARTGHYVLLTNELTGESGNPHPLTSHQAREIDRKMDDGNPFRGAVIAAGNAECIEKSKNTYVYRSGNKACLSLYIRIQ